MVEVGGAEQRASRPPDGAAGSVWISTDSDGIDSGSPVVYSIPLPIRFRGVTERQGVVWRGSRGWAEWSPFLDYPVDEARPWFSAALEMAEEGYPPAVRDTILVNATIPAVSPEMAHDLTTRSGCATAKVKVAERGGTLKEDIARVEAVRSALGADGKVRIDANGGWSVDEARKALGELARFDLEYVEQPCRTVEELAELRALVRPKGILVAADESIRRADDPYRVRDFKAADIAVLKVQPLGGVRRCLRVAERIGMDVVVSSAVETSIGLRAGVALAAALPELNYACGLNTSSLLARDVTAEPLRATNGQIQVRDVDVSTELVRAARADAATTEFWHDRWDSVISSQRGLL